MIYHVHKPFTRRDVALQRGDTVDINISAEAASYLRRGYIGVSAPVAPTPRTKPSKPAVPAEDAAE